MRAELIVWVCVLACIASSTSPVLAQVAAPDDPSVVLYDTVYPSAVRLSSETLSDKTHWKAIPEDKLDHKFAGDAVMMNDRLAIVFRVNGAGAEIYARAGGGWNDRATLIPFAVGAVSKITHRVPGDIFPPPGSALHVVELASLRTVENNTGAVVVESTWETSSAATFETAFSCRLTTGQVFLEVVGGAKLDSLLIRTNPHLLVVPDFFGDDLVSGPESQLQDLVLPAENMLLHLGGKGSSIVQVLWPDGRQRVRETLRTPRVQVLGAYGVISPLAGSRIDCAKDQRVFVAFFEGAGLWHYRSASRPSASQPAATGKPPFPARWRVSVNDTKGPQSFRLEDAPPEKGSPPTTEDEHYGRLTYLLDRDQQTALTTFTPIDIMRATLGFGPCKSLLDLEGFSQGAGEEATPDQVMNYLEAQAKLKQPDVQQARTKLAAMTRQVREVQKRVEDYAAFARAVRALPAKEMPETMVPLLDYMDRCLQACPASVCDQCDKVAEIMGELIGYAHATLPDWAQKVRRIGLAQNRCLSQCRMAIRKIRLLCDPALGHQELVSKTDTARKILALIDQIQNPAGPASRPTTSPGKE